MNLLIRLNMKLLLFHWKVHHWLCNKTAAARAKKVFEVINGGKEGDSACG